MEMSGIADHEPWPARAALLAATGAVLGFLFAQLMDRPNPGPAQLSMAAFVGVGGIVLALTLERVRWDWSLAFAVGCAAVVGAIFYWQGPSDEWSSGDEWRVFAAFLAVAIATPLFQAARDEGHRNVGSAAVHAHAWTDLVMWCAAWAFVAATFLLAFLLSELFHMIGIDLLRDALRESQVAAALGGAAGGAAAGLLRDRDAVLALLQRVATTILSVLAPVLAAGLVLFVLALPFTGLERLWDETRSTTPILLFAIAGAFLLANAVIGNAPEEEAQGRVLRWSAAALAGVMTPLAIIAAVSTSLRIGQYGFTPERLWALVFVGIAVAVAGAYLWTLARGRLGWSERVRPMNVRLAIGLCALSVLLSMPLVDFGAISTRDQLARLESGRTRAERFDWAALRFDFGPSGRAALERLSEAGPPPLRARAADVLAAGDRWSIEEERRTIEGSERIAERLKIVPAAVELPKPLRDALVRQGVCRSGPCTLHWQSGSTMAVAVGFPCEGCQVDASRLQQDEFGGWRSRSASDLDTVSGPPASIEEQRKAVEQGRVEVRSVQRRQIYVDGKPIGVAFE